jgi:WD domain, G-beta repeat
MTASCALRSAIGVLAICPFVNAQDLPLPQPKPLAVLRGHTNAVWGLDVTRDGRTIVSGSFDKTIKVWDAATGRERFTLRGHTRCVEFVVVSPDGQTVYSADQAGVVRFWDLVARRERREPIETGSRPRFLFLSSDGRTLSLGDRHHYLRQWDLTSGKELAVGNPRRVQVNLVSADGRLGAGEDRKPHHVVEVFDLPSGRVLTAVSAHQPYAFSPDNRTLFASDPTTEDVWLWELATGLVRAMILSVEQSHIGMVAVHPHGRLLALPREESKALRLIDLATGKAVADLKIDNDTIHRFKFSADGRILACSEGPDTTIRVWDVSGLAAGLPRKERLSPAERDAVWADLAGTDASRAYRAVWVLAGAMKDSAAWLGERLTPVVLADGKVTARLIADLDSDKFAIRDQAAAELEQLGDAAAPALRQALAGAPSMEARERIETLLRRLDALPPSRIRSLRAVEALEYAATPEARLLLEALAGGLAEARLTREAKASVERLAKR